MPDNGDNSREPLSSKILQAITTAEIVGELLKPAPPVPIPNQPVLDPSRNQTISQTENSAPLRQPNSTADLVADLAEHRERVWEQARERAMEDLLAQREPEQREERPSVTPER